MQFLHAACRIPTTCCVWRGEEPGWASPRMVPENAMFLSPRLAPPSPLTTRHPQTQRALAAQNSQLAHTAAGSNGVLRAAGAGRGRESVVQ